MALSLRQLKDLTASLFNSEVDVIEFHSNNVVVMRGNLQSTIGGPKLCFKSVVLGVEGSGIYFELNDQDSFIETFFREIVKHQEKIRAFMKRVNSTRPAEFELTGRLFNLAEEAENV